MSALQTGSMCSRWELEMPPSFKDAWCSLVSNAAFGCWQLCQTIPGWVVIFQGGLRLLIKFGGGGKVSSREPGCFQERGYKEIKHLSLFCFKILPFEAGA